MLICIKNKLDNSVLYEGRHPSLGKCLEAAIYDGKDLSDANLKNACLTNASLDGARLPGADFTGANLTGANLSEANLAGSCFSNATMHNSCLCYSNLSSCAFRYTSFGATDMAGAILNNSVFAGLPTFTLSFHETLSMKNCIYEEINGAKLLMSSPPLVIAGLERHLAVLDESLLAGNSGLTFLQELGTFAPQDKAFLHRHSKLVSMLIETKYESRQPKVVDKYSGL